MLLLTVIVLIAMFLFSYKLFDRDLFAPPTVVCISFLFSTLCAFYNENTWGLDFSSKTTIVMIIGIGTFLIGGIFGVFLSNGRNLHRFAFSHQVSPVQAIVIEKWKVFAVILFQMFLMVAIYRELMQNVGFLGVSWAQIIHMYRHESMSMVGQDYSMKLSYLVRQLINIDTALVFLFSYFVGNNLAIKKKIEVVYLIPIVLGCVITFMQGFRAEMIRYWVAILVVWYTVYKRSIGWKSSKETSKMIKKMTISALIVCMVFSSVRAIVGRNVSGNWDPLYYVTFYGGCPVAALDLFLKEPHNDNTDDIWGKETFYFLNQSIGAWLKIPEYRYSISGKGFQRSNNGTYVGNVYTALRHPIADFGYVGLPVVMFSMGCFFTFFYCKVRRKYCTKKVDFLLLSYSYCAYTFFLYFFSAYYFFISTIFLKTLLLWYILHKALMTRFIIRNHNC